jgi:hypothetical protein
LQPSIECRTLLISLQSEAAVALAVVLDSQNFEPSGFEINGAAKYWFGYILSDLGH